MKRPCWLAAAAALLVIVAGVTAQCPWSRSVPALHGSCACSYNLAQELTLQCGQVNFTTLLEALHGHAHNQIIDLLYVHNSSVPELRDNMLNRLTVHNIQLSRCQIRSIGQRAFAGQEESLKNLNLQDNLINAVPTEALRPLKVLALLDLSGNRIGRVPADAFAPLKLTTLKLADNGNLTLSENAFRGLEPTLKNLNLKGTRLREVPADALRPLTSLAFLDLAQNGIRSLGSGLFRYLDSLTALNLERNSLSAIEPEAFTGVNDTLSSLSLLNNLITEFPVRGLASLSQLRVLDVGFNLMSELPENAFSPASQLTLLALDGNPLATLPRSAFGHLNGTLRGLSLGGRFLVCDCRLRWIAEWIRDTDLQVTSRERNPQFCGSPVELRTRSFYQLAPEEFKCLEEPVKASTHKEEGFKPITSSSTSATTTTEPATTVQTTIRGKVYDDEVEEIEDEEFEAEKMPVSRPSATNTAAPTTLPTTSASAAAPTFAPQPALQPVPQSPSRRQQQAAQLQKQSGSLVQGSSRPADVSPVSQRNSPAPNYRGSYQRPVTASSANKNNRGPGTRTRPYGPSGRPNLITGNSNGYHGDNLGIEGIPSSSSSLSGEREVIVKDAYRQDTSVVIQWDSETSHILGFRVVYRLFGDNTFQPGPPLDPSEREFKIKNVPAQESLVVCVVSLEESNVTPETVPFAQCREIRTESQPSSHMDKIIIAASAAICGTVVLAVVIFICCNRKRSLKSEKLRLSNVLAAGGVAGPGMVAAGPGGCGNNGIGTATTSLAGSQGQGPLAGLGMNGQGANGKDWDQLSMYSSRSIPRARMYHSDRPGSVMGSVNGAFIPDDARSHVSGYSMNKSGAAGNLIRSRSLIDGQSARSVSALSGRGGAYLPPAMHHSGLGPHLGGLGMGLGGLAMPGLGGSMNAMAGLPSLTGMGLSRAGRMGCSTKTVKTINGNENTRKTKTKTSAAHKPPSDLRASHHSLADLRMNELAAASAMSNGRASRNSRASTRAGSQYSGRRSEQMRRRSGQLQHHDSSDQHHHQQQTTGDESSWETDREPGGGGSSSTSGLLAGRRSQQMASIHSQRHGNGHRPRAGSSVRSGETENWTDHDMDIYTTNHTMRNDLVRL